MYVIIKKGTGRMPTLEVVTGIIVRNVQPEYSDDSADALCRVSVQVEAVDRLPRSVYDCVGALQFEYKESAMALVLALSHLDEDVLAYDILSLDV